MPETVARTVRGRQLALVVRIGTSLHALPISAVEEVLPALPIEWIPQCPPFVRGVVFVRGHLIPVLDAAERLGLRNHVRPPEPHIVCLRVGSRLVGLEVDEAVNLIEVSLGDALPVEEVNAQRGFMSGLIEQDGQVIRLLDAERMIAQPEVVVWEPVPRMAAR